jgi:hypothetical protein
MLRPGQGASLLWRALRGLAVGVAAMGLAVLTTFAILHLVPSRTECDATLACMPDIRPVLLAALSIAVVVTVGGPVVGWVLRAPRPLVFELPVLWTLVLLCVGTGPGDWQRHWPFNDGLSDAVILACLYGLAGLWAFRPRVPTSTVAVESGTPQR